MTLPHYRSLIMAAPDYPLETEALVVWVSLGTEGPAPFICLS
jgi:hypothetical protein